MRDEAEIRGHRRTYIGSMPGKIIQSLRKAKTSNPLFLLDEIDKMGQDFRGDPSSRAAGGAGPRAELDLRRSLSRGRFRPVERDVHHHGQHAEHSPGADGPHGDHPHRRYTEEEKVEIAKKHLIPASIKKHGLTDKEWSITPEALDFLVQRYTRESGVRNLERKSPISSARP